jgi:hypothetical protein
MAEAIRAGRGVGWHEHHHDLYQGTERFFRPNYIGNLLSSWIPALDGVEEKLRAGAKVADVGCGYGLRRSSWPRSTQTRRSSGSTTMTIRARASRGRPRIPGSTIVAASRWLRPKGTQAPLPTIGWRSSTLCTTCAIPSGSSPYVLDTFKPDGT